MLFTPHAHPRKKVDARKQKKKLQRQTQRILRKSKSHWRMAEGLRLQILAGCSTMHFFKSITCFFFDFGLWFLFSLEDIQFYSVLPKIFPISKTKYFFLYFNERRRSNFSTSTFFCVFLREGTCQIHRRRVVSFSASFYVNGQNLDFALNLASQFLSTTLRLQNLLLLLRKDTAALTSLENQDFVVRFGLM